MSKIKTSDIIKNKALMGLLGKACHCSDHDPFQHFNLLSENQEVEIKLTLNNIEVPQAAEFINAYYKQMEGMITERVKALINGELREFRVNLLKLKDLTQEMQNRILKQIDPHTCPECQEATTAHLEGCTNQGMVVDGIQSV